MANLSISPSMFHPMFVGPLRDLYWTSNRTGLNKDRSFEVPDNGTVLEPNPWYGPLTACAVLVSNVEPVVNITIGKPGEEGTEDVTDQFETREASVYVKGLFQ